MAIRSEEWNEQLLVLSALADPTRFAILRLLLERDLCVGGLARELAVSEPAVSQHMKKLRQCGLVTGEKRGYWVHYSVNADTLVRMADALKSLAVLTRTGARGCPGRGAAGTCRCPSGKGQEGLRVIRLEARAGEDNGSK